MDIVDTLKTINDTTYYNSLAMNSPKYMIDVAY